MNEYRIFFRNKEWLIIEANHFSQKSNRLEGPQYLKFYIGKNTLVAQFSLDEIVGFVNEKNLPRGG